MKNTFSKMDHSKKCLKNTIWDLPISSAFPVYDLIFVLSQRSSLHLLQVKLNLAPSANLPKNIYLYLEKNKDYKNVGYPSK